MKPVLHQSANILAIALWGFTAMAAAEEAPQYNRDVRPILAENCFRCHGPDSAARKADLRLDVREVAIQVGAFEPGKADSSELVRRIFSSDTDEVMPPPAAHKQLTAAQKETLKRWIAAGAEYQPHWSLIPPRRVDPPAVKNEAWVKTPIDRFILAKLESLGLSPAAEADRRTLARRASLDLTGLPPDARRRRKVRQRPAIRCLRKIRRSSARIAGVGRASRRGTGSIWRAMPIPTAFISTITARTGRFAIT